MADSRFDMRSLKIDNFATCYVCDSPTNYEGAFPSCGKCLRLWSNRLHETRLQSYSSTIKPAIVTPYIDKRVCIHFVLFVMLLLKHTISKEVAVQDFSQSHFTVNIRVAVVGIILVIVLLQDK